MADLVSDGRKARVCAVDEDGRITHLHTVDTLLSYNGSIPITRSRQPSKSPVITDGAFSFLAFAGLDRMGLGRNMAL